MTAQGNTQMKPLHPTTIDKPAMHRGLVAGLGAGKDPKQAAYETEKGAANEAARRLAENREAREKFAGAVKTQEEDKAKEEAAKNKATQDALDKAAHEKKLNEEKKKQAEKAKDERRQELADDLKKMQ